MHLLLSVMQKLLICLLIFVLIFESKVVRSQGSVGGYVDFNHGFSVFENMNKIQIEDSPVMSFKNGRGILAYEDNSGNLKVYSDGIKYDMERGKVNRYFIMDGMVIYQIGTYLRSTTGSKSETLAGWSMDFDVGDSIVAFVDGYSQTLNAYYKGRKFELEDLLVNQAFRNFSVGANLIAYSNVNGNTFKVFYRGEILEYNYIVPSGNDYQAGLNVVAFIDETSGTFMAFYQGNLVELEPLKPKSFKVGDNIIAYIDITGEFKLFHSGSIKTVLSYEPELYDLSDSVLIYMNGNEFHAVYSDEDYLLESYYPKNYSINGRIMAYDDINTGLKLFDAGKQSRLSYEKVKQFEVLPDLVLYTLFNNKTKVYYQGDTY